MSNQIRIVFAAYLTSIVLGNLLVAYMGRWGIVITSFIFIPFDFVIRCYIHELYRGAKLYAILFAVISAGAVITFIVNRDAGAVALGSVLGFVAGGLSGSIFYQIAIKKRAFVKVNGSDITALVVDSIVFQLVAFSSIALAVISGQIVVKIAGGLLWYYILFVKFGLLKKVKFKNYR